MNNTAAINKTMDIRDLNSAAALKIIDEINNVIREVKNKNLRISSWYGKFDLDIEPHIVEYINRGYGYESFEWSIDDTNFPWFLYWEIVWVVMNNNYMEGEKILDLGGSSSLFSYYLASKGMNVTTIDLQTELVDNANHVAVEMGWNLENYAMDIREIDFDRKFNHITAICVYEHIPMYDRFGANRKVNELMVDGGTFSLTFDYRNPTRQACISSPEQLYEQFVYPSGLDVRGNKEFSDNNENYLLQPFYYNKRVWRYKIYSILKRRFSPLELLKTKDVNDYTFGALFLQKPPGDATKNSV
jgi:2-polyprenyl-3-methyl-5-hydroxy-6-metoxy-1,4-benzoquinol methylase